MQARVRRWVSSALIIASMVAVARAERTREPLVGRPCEGCEAVFEGLPEAIPSKVRIGREDEPGEPMRIDGTVFDAKGRPVAGVIVYAYHTDHEGIYPTGDRSVGAAGYRHGRLRAWAKTDENGRYCLETIRPAGYPGTTLPSHVHMHVIEVGRCTYYIDDVLFDDDPRLTPETRRSMTTGRGGNGVATPKKDGSGVWIVTRDIRLGEKVPGYPERPGD